jgi:hypothetical protein
MLILGQGPLPPFLQQAGARPFEWGSWDCLMWLAEWVKARRGVDPGADHRHHYSSALEAARIVAKAGGMVAHVDECVLPLGLKRTDDPKAGDIVVVDSPHGKMGALVIGPGSVACAMQQGLLYVRTADWPILAAWSV